MKTLHKYIEDILILSGLLIISGTTFFIHVIAGFYLLGIIIFGIGLYLAKYPLGR